jgi:hypothetical protein
MNLFSKSKNVFENAAKGMYTQASSQHSVTPDKVTFRAKQTTNTSFKDKRATYSQKESLIKNNVSF